MEIKDQGEGNEINVEMPQSSPTKVDVSGNDHRIDVASFSGAVTIEVSGKGSVIDIRRMRRAGRLRVVCKNGGSVSIGEHSSAEDLYILADGATVTIGEDMMASFQVSIRTTDAHGIYDAATGKLTNGPEDIFIGDHVWLAQGVVVAKGSKIGKNSVIGAMSYLSRADIPNGSLVAGTPPRILRENIVWDRRMTPDLFAEGADFDQRLPKYFAMERT